MCGLFLSIFLYQEHSRALTLLNSQRNSSWLLSQVTPPLYVLLLLQCVWTCAVGTSPLHLVHIVIVQGSKDALGTHEGPASSRLEEMSPAVATPSAAGAARQTQGFSSAWDTGDSIGDAVSVSNTPVTVNRLYRRCRWVSLMHFDGF
jgi:hypothetical protein